MKQFMVYIRYDGENYYDASVYGHVTATNKMTAAAAIARKLSVEQYERIKEIRVIELLKMEEIKL